MCNSLLYYDFSCGEEGGGRSATAFEDKLDECARWAPRKGNAPVHHSYRKTKLGGSSV